MKNPIRNIKRILLSALTLTLSFTAAPLAEEEDVILGYADSAPAYSAATVSITRAQALANARAFAELKWTLSAANRAGGYAITIPDWIKAVPSLPAIVTGVPYCWGGCMTTLDYITKINAGFQAGNVDIYTTYSYVYGTAGVDCSGLASKVYNLSTYANTTAFYNAGYTKIGWDDLCCMDFLLKRKGLVSTSGYPGNGNHIMMVVSRIDANTFYIVDSAAAVGKVAFRTMKLTDLITEGYTPYRAFATGHIKNSAWEYDGETHYHTCANGCHNAEYDRAPHTFVSGDTAKTCSTCGYSVPYPVLSFDLSGADGEVEDIYDDPGDGKKVILPDAPAWEGYIFTGWETAEGKLYVPGDELDITEDTTLYACWELKTEFLVTLDPNGGKGGANLTKTLGEDLELPFDETDLPEKEGFFFMGWAESKEQAADGIVIYPSIMHNTITEDADIALYASWLEDPFADVQTARWYRRYVGYAYKYGIMTGYNENTFGPLGTLTRAEMATILYRLAGSPELEQQEPEQEQEQEEEQELGEGDNPEDTLPFPDVPLGKYYSDPVIWGKAVGVIKGTNDGFFLPNENIIRQDFVLMLYRYTAEVCGIDTSVENENALFEKPDGIKVSVYARPAMNWGYVNGLIGQGSDLCPHQSITRAECAAIMARFMYNITGVSGET
ncbi:MAG: S-layer homology domain-containing protein [Lachnospiraceae bacterium]|nr:S-layer homology domain-containing protein [Lachnospiraceae bacterium]